jgi:hypothetical protein
MRVLSSIFTLAFISCSIHSSTPRHSEESNPSHLTFDAAKIAIIKHVSKKESPFDSTYRSGSLIQSDLLLIDSMLLACAKGYNDSLGNNNGSSIIDLKGNYYRMQLVPATNVKGEREVWVNCFCLTMLQDWKRKIQVVMDGSSCFFSFKINLSTKKYYELSVNGVA